MILPCEICGNKQMLYGQQVGTEELNGEVRRRTFNADVPQTLLIEETKRKFQR
jgi:hypothetical protein